MTAENSDNFLECISKLIAQVLVSSVHCSQLRDGKRVASIFASTPKNSRGNSQFQKRFLLRIDAKKQKISTEHVTFSDSASLDQFCARTLVVVQWPATLLSFFSCSEAMTRLGNGTSGMARAIGIATLAPGGTVAVPAALVLDEVEHYRAGRAPDHLKDFFV